MRIVLRFICHANAHVDVLGLMNVTCPMLQAKPRAEIIFSSHLRGIRSLLPSKLSRHILAFSKPLLRGIASSAPVFPPPTFISRSARILAQRCPFTNIDLDLARTDHIQPDITYSLIMTSVLSVRAILAHHSK